MILKDIQSWLRNISQDLPRDCTQIREARVEEVEIFEVDIPFKHKFKHALAARKSSSSIVVKIKLAGGIVGYGEGLPREYVTGETLEGAVAKIKNDFIPKILGKSFSSFLEVIAFCRPFTDVDLTNERLQPTQGAAWSACELALLDAGGIFFNRSITDVCGAPQKPIVHYSGVISAGTAWQVLLSALKMKIFGFQHIKVKVGYPNDTNLLVKIRTILGPRVNLRVDANAAWTRDLAYNWIKDTSKINLAAIEQPLAKEDIEGLSYLFKHSHLPIMADESMTNLYDAHRLVQFKSCHMFNIRISKCGGLIHANAIKHFADSRGIRCQIGCQVGETGILSAAGRALAFAYPNVDFIEGSYERILLTEDIVHPRIRFGYRGKAYPIIGRGIGIFVKEDVLQKYVTRKHFFKALENEFSEPHRASL